MIVHIPAISFLVTSGSNLFRIFIRSFESKFSLLLIPLCLITFLRLDSDFRQILRSCVKSSFPFLVILASSSSLSSSSPLSPFLLPIFFHYSPFLLALSKLKIKLKGISSSTSSKKDSIRFLSLCDSSNFLFSAVLKACCEMVLLSGSIRSMKSFLGVVLALTSSQFTFLKKGNEKS